VFRALMAALVITITTAAPASSQVFVTVGFNIDNPPPPIPQYDQPPVPEPGYIWQPGYWAYGDYGYYWVPGCWVQAPAPGLLWTPGYWGFGDGYFGWHPGYWASEVGFYGGVNYGGGYYGNGYAGGQWRGDYFAYNSYVSNVPPDAPWAGERYVYEDRSVQITNITVNNISYNGGPGGIPVAPTERELAVEQLPHVPATHEQLAHMQVAGQDRRSLATVNHGQPPVVTAQRPIATPDHVPGFTPVRPEDRELLTHPLVPTATPDTNTVSHPEPRPVAAPPTEPRPVATPANPPIPMARPTPHPTARPATTPRPATAPRPAPHPRPTPRATPHPTPP
jgi:hypothetical protein